jgi:hypothetical protein
MKHCLILASLCCGPALLAGAAEFPVYPSGGGLNLRVPVVAPVAGGVKGNRLPFEMVRFTYELAPHLTGLEAGSVSLFVEDSMRRPAKEVLTLGGPAGELKVVIPAAPSQERRFRLESGEGRADSRGTQAPGKWHKLLLTWGNGRAGLTLENGETLEVKLPENFTVQRLGCSASLVDELELKGGGGSFSIGWERDYSGRLVPAGQGGVTAAVHGFDTYVIGSDPEKRDYPLVQLLNSTKERREVTLRYELQSEVNRIRNVRQEKRLLEPGSSTMVPVMSPALLQSDVYHLLISIDGLSAPFRVKKNFLHVARRPEPAGPGLFGLHDCDVKAFGFWPDALPLRYAHKYLRWGWVQGPAFVDHSTAPEHDPAAPPQEWNWNAALDWELMAGRELFVSLQSYPYSAWHREREYPRGMKQWPSAKGGGFPDLKKYARFLRESAERYRGRIRHYEIENEPNAYGMPEHPEDYAEVCRTVYRTVKAVDPDARIYGVCGTGSFLPWMKRALAAGATGSFDVLSYHTYTTPRQPDQANLRRFLGEVREAAPAGIRRFNSETGVLQALRYEADRPIPPETVALAAKERRTGFVSTASWPGRVNDEWEASASIVKNAVINLASGSEGFIFFGWNPEWPKGGKPWTEREPDFSLLSATPAGERTPSLLSLAVAVLAAQFESADPGKPYRWLDSGEVRGALFSKAAAGRVAVLWAADAAADVLVTAPGNELETVNVFGERRIFRAVPGAGRDGRGVFLLPLTTMPRYVHLADGELEVLSSPVSAVEVENIVGGTGSVALTLLNTGDEVWNARLEAGAVPGLVVSPREEEVAIRPGRRRKVKFDCRLEAGAKGSVFELPVTLRLPNNVELTRGCRIGVSASGAAGEVPENFVLAAGDALDGFAPELKLDRIEQAVFGRPSDTASIQEAHFWGGPAELSGGFRLGWNREALFVAGWVRDIHPRLPEVWPGALGSCVELFFDFRTPAEGLGKAQYGRNVLQFLILPPVAGKTKPELWCPQLPELPAETVRLCGAAQDRQEYWIGLTIPWKLVRADGNPPERFGFDAGINGSFGDRDGRKAQLMLFGTARNFCDASKFGMIPVGKGRRGQ